MGYCINYQPNRKNKFPLLGMIRIFLLTGLCFAAFCFGVRHFLPEGDAILHKMFLIPGRFATVSALNTFAEELKTGEAFDVAFFAFCKSLIS